LLSLARQFASFFATFSPINQNGTFFFFTFEATPSLRVNQTTWRQSQTVFLITAPPLPKKLIQIFPSLSIFVTELSKLVLTTRQQFKPLLPPASYFPPVFFPLKSLQKLRLSFAFPVGLHGRVAGETSLAGCFYLKEDPFFNSKRDLCASSVSNSCFP